MFSKPCGDDRVTICELPLLDLSKACADVFGEGAIDCDAGRSVGWVSESLEIGLGLAFSLEGSWIACLHVDAGDVPRVVVHRVPKAAVTMFYAGLLDVFQKGGWSRLPAVLVFDHDISGVVLSESFVGQGWVA